MKNKTNKARAIWCKLFQRENFHNLVLKYRERAAVPKNGFTSKNNFHKWFEQIKKLKTEHRPSIYVVQFQKEAISSNSDLDLSGFESVLEEYFFYGKVYKDTLAIANTTGCSIVPVMHKEGETLEEGIYIKIGAQSSIKEVKDYIDAKKGWIRAYQTAFRKTKGIKKTRYHIASNSRRDTLISGLSKRSKSDREKLGGGTGPKYIQIENIMKKNGWKIASDNVRKIISRQSKLRKLEM